MKTLRFTILLLAVLTLRASAQDQRVVLFETFTNSCDMCPMGNDLDALFRSTLQQQGTKIIHLNHHGVNVCDPMTAAAPQTMNQHYRLTGDKGPNFTLFMGAVDHTKFTSTNKRVTSGVPGCKDEWDARINQRTSVSPMVRITPMTSQLDRIGQDNFWRVTSKIRVTALQNITDSMYIYFAVTEDGVYYPQCADSKPPGPEYHDNVVRYITTTGIPVNLIGKSSGEYVVVDYVQDITKAASYGFHLENMKVIAYVEKSKNGDFEVVQATKLIPKISDLPTATKRLELNEAILNGISYHPDENLVISFDKTSIDSVKIEYSTDDGNVWHEIGVTTQTPFFWQVPEIYTTLGKIRVSDQRDGFPSATQSGNFSIVSKDYDIKVLRPNGNDTAYLNKSFTIEWSKIGLENVNIEYSPNGGKTWGIVATKKSGTTHNWFVTGSQTEQAYIRIWSVAPNGDTIRASSDPFHVLQGVVVGVKNPAEQKEFSVQLYPQPVRRGSSISVDIHAVTDVSLTIRLYDLTGKEIGTLGEKRIVQGSSTLSSAVPDVPAGAYIVEIVSSHGERLTRQIEIY